MRGTPGSSCGVVRARGSSLRMLPTNISYPFYQRTPHITRGFDASRRSVFPRRVGVCAVLQSVWSVVRSSTFRVTPSLSRNRMAIVNRKRSGSPRAPPTSK